MTGIISLNMNGILNPCWNAVEKRNKCAAHFLSRELLDSDGKDIEEQPDRKTQYICKTLIKCQR